MHIIDDGILLDAKLEMPKNAGKCPLAIIIHGYTGNKEERHILAVSRMFNELGLATLRVDMYGHGESGGEFRNHTLFKWMTNALTVIDYARSLDFVTDIYLCGHSQGGLTVMLAGAMKSDQIKAIIPMSPAIVIPEGARKGRLLGMEFDPSHIPEQFQVKEDKTLSGNYVRVARTIRVEDFIDSYSGPVFLIHGSADESIPVQCSIDASKRYRNAKLVVVEGDTHCYDYHLGQVVESIRAWMKEQLH